MVIAGCKKPYAPKAISTNNNLLVVEGVINTGNDSTVIRLSRTVSISGKTTANPEQGATVTIESDQAVSYQLQQVDSGRYTSAPLNLDNTHKYRLRINTADGRTYLSDYVEAKVTPPIDTFDYAITGSGINFYTSTHDAANKTKYYRWDYTETYIYESVLSTSIAFDNSYPLTSQKFRYVPPDERTHICYVTAPSSTVVLNSNAGLSQDVVINNPITQVPSTSEKLYHRYTIQVRQYALTREAFEFWSNLKKNTEQIGTIYDAQPSEIKGNIHCLSNAAEPVIGYISASTVTQKRLFIDNRDLPGWPIPDQGGCTTQLLKWDDGVTPPELTSGVWIPVGTLNKTYNVAQKDTQFSVKAGYYDCVDCRYHLHGTNIKHGFWK